MTLTYRDRGKLEDVKDIVVDARRALARLDAERLEEIAMSCQALDHALSQEDVEGGCELQRAGGAAKQEMAVLARVLEMTQANRNVLNRGREMRATRLEYGRGVESFRNNAEIRYGDN